MSTREAKTSCRICSGVCALTLTLDENDKIIAARGDKSNPVTRGFACIKGLHAHTQHYSEDRILHPLKRRADGSFERIKLETALDEIAEKLKAISASHGSEAIAGFRGTSNYLNLAACHMLPDWLTSIGSNSFYSTMTIDQSAKWVAFERLGMWGAGLDPFDSADVLMMIGTNPLVSMGTWNYPMQDPIKVMRTARARGLKLVIIDPRRTETARHADILLQPLPGEDVTIVAGLLRIILNEGWHDAEFCAKYVNNLAGLKEAVAPYTPEYVAKRADIAADGLIAAARMFAEPLKEKSGTRRKRGSAASGTATNMGPHSNLAEHLVECLNVVCGRFARAGDPVGNPGVVGPRYPRVATVMPPKRSWETGWKSRVGGLGMIYGQKMSGVMAQEIITPGPGQMRALFVVGGNPINAVPDQRQIVDAFKQLDLLVTVDPFMTNTALLSHYVIPPKMMFERADLPSRDFEPFTTLQPYAQYSAPVIAPPKDSEVIDDWLIFWSLAKQMGHTITFDGVALDMQTPPTTDELLAFLTRNSVVQLEEIRRYPAGKLFDSEPMVVQPTPEGDTGKFEVIPDDVRDELAQVFGETPKTNGYSHRLSVRRLREVHNTSFHKVPAIHHAMPYNAAYINPDDLSEMGITGGELIGITSAHGHIEAIAEADDSLRRGIVSMAHGWGGLPDDNGDITEKGVSVNLLVSAKLSDLDPINGMAVMTGIPVRVERHATSNWLP
jgi:anaerobic selenocysteine-containing dehydrogenase